MSPDQILQTTKDLIRAFKNLISISPFGNKYCLSIDEIEKTLMEPCRLAITGRVKAGKSTLINVLLGFDYAVVGTSETTATINIFKFGKPEYADKPILCEYIDGSTEWVSKEYLDSLQGFTNDIVSKISSIKHFTFFIDDPHLKDTILIDTPGLDAVVGDDGDAHQIQTESFLGLRKRHEEETVFLSSSADAVLLLLGDVAHESDVDFINGFLNNRGNMSSINTIAVMAQIDLTDERVQHRQSIARDRYEKLSAYVNCVLPISAGLKRFMPTLSEAQRIKDTFASIPSKDILDKLVLRSPKVYFLPSIPGIDLSLKERKAIYPEGIPFRCFAVITKILYEYNPQDAIRMLNEISGIERLKETLELQFFGRSKQIKAEMAIKQTLSLIWDLLNCNIPSAASMLSEDKIDEMSNQFYDIQLSLEKLSQVTEDINRYFQGLISVIENKDLFSEAEYKELFELLSDKVSDYDESRLNYWYGEKNNSMNIIRRNTANLAYSKYTDIAFNKK